MSGRLAGRVGIVTGAGSGIGRATALRMAAEGAAVVVADIDEQTAQAMVDEIEGAGGVAVAQWVDVAEEPAVRAMVDAAVDAFGALHLLHNNAAHVGVVPDDVDIVGMDVAVWDATMAVNVRGPMLGCKHAIPHMLEAGGGSIVNTSSVSGQVGDLSRPAYGASKAALQNLTQNVATLYGKQGIRCNAVAPGVIETPALAANIPPEQLAVFERAHLTPHMGRPEDIASMVVYLCSDEARFVTGQVVNVDGGMVSHHTTYGEFLRGS